MTEKTFRFPVESILRTDHALKNGGSWCSQRAMTAGSGPQDRQHALKKKSADVVFGFLRLRQSRYDYGY